MDNSKILASLPQEAKTIIQLCGGNYRQAFYTLCKQKGIDPKQFLEELKGMI